VPGFLGLLPDDHGIRALLRFEETDDTIAPADALGALSAVRPAGSFPDVVDGYTSRARDFDGTTGIQATDGGGALILERTVSVVALLEWDHASTVGPDAIAAHGVRGSAIERRSWHLRLSKLGGGVGRVAWVWEDRSGTEYVQAGGDFFLPASGYMLVSATREWCGDHFELRYWVGETLLAEHETTDLEVGGGLDATVTIGCVGDGAGGFVERFHGRLDQLAIFGAALTQSQVTHLWQRLAMWGPDLYLALRDLQPVGSARTREPSSLVQRRIRTQSGGLAAASALVALRAGAGLPDRAYGPRLELWERTTALQALASDCVAIRQARVLAALLGEQGLSENKILENLAPLYGLDPSELVVIRFDNVTIGRDYPAWGERGDGAVLVDAITDDITLRVEASAEYSTLLGGYAYHTAALEQPIITCTVEATSLSNDDLFVGLADAEQLELAGVKLDTSAGQIVNTISGANIQAYVLPVELLVFRDGADVLARINGAAAITLGAAAADLVHGQVALVPTSASVPGSGRDARVTGLRVQNLDSRATQTGYVYGDTAADLPGARRQLRRQQPAHAHCAALVGARALRCDDAVNGLDVAPLVETQLDCLRAMFGDDAAARAWAGAPADLVAGALLTAAGAASYGASGADAPNDGPFGDQALTFTDSLTDKWTLPAGVLAFSSTTAVALVLVYFISSYTPGTAYTLIGNREGANLNGFELGIDTAGRLVARMDSGAPAPTELVLQSVSTAPGWHAAAMKYDSGTTVLEFCTELQYLSTTFAANPVSATATALGAYRSERTPAWRCSLLVAFAGAEAVLFDPVAAVKYQYRHYARSFDHVEQLRYFVELGISPDLCWSGSSIDDAALQPLSRLNSAIIQACPSTKLAGPVSLGLFGTQEWRALDATVGHLDLTQSALILVGAAIVSFGASLESMCGDRSGTGAGDAGWELVIASGGIPRVNLDDAGGAPVSVDLTAASSTAGKHAYLIRWNATTRAITFVSEVSAASGSFAGRNPATSNPFRLGSVRGLTGVAWDALCLSVFYDAVVTTLSDAQLIAMAARVKAEI
jgi:hypothetical protein